MMLSFALLCALSAAELPKKHQFTIYMILFKGKGECERGFTNYMRSRNLNINYIIRDCAGNLQSCPIEKFKKEIRDSKVDLVYTWGTPLTQAFAGTIDNVQKNPQNYITNIPIIALPIANPVGAKLTTKMDVPTKRNLAGISQMMPVSEQINALRFYQKDFKRIGAFYTPYEENIVSYIREWEAAAKQSQNTPNAFSFISKPLPLDASGHIDGSIIPQMVKEMAEQKIDFLYLGPDTAILDFAQEIVKHTNEYKIPTYAVSELSVQTISPLLGFFSRFYHVGQLAGLLSEQILMKTGKPDDIYKFTTLKYMSYSYSVSKMKAVKSYPPIKLLKFAEILYK